MMSFFKTLKRERPKKSMTKKKEKSHPARILWCYDTLNIATLQYFLKFVYKKKNKICLTYIFIFMHTLFHNLFNKFPIQC